MKQWLPELARAKPPDALLNVLPQQVFDELQGKFCFHSRVPFLANCYDSILVEERRVAFQQDLEVKPRAMGKICASIGQGVRLQLVGYGERVPHSLSGLAKPYWVRDDTGLRPELELSGVSS